MVETKDRIAYKASWYTRNREKARATQRAYCVQNREKVAAAHRAYYARTCDRDRVVRNTAKRAYRAANPACDKAYRRPYGLNRNYGLTEAIWGAMFVSQESCCGACGNVSPGGKYWHTDHDHTKKKGDPGFVRGILCSSCNLAIGQVKDSPDRLRKLIAYLERPQ